MCRGIGVAELQAFGLEDFERLGSILKTAPVVKTWRDADALWKMLADAPEFATADVSGVKWFISGGAPLPKHLIDVYRERGIVLRQGYGLTEVGVNCFAMSNEEAWLKAGAIGRPLMFTDAKIIDEAGQELRPGEVGELCPLVRP